MAIGGNPGLHVQRADWTSDQSHSHEKVDIHVTESACQMRKGSGCRLLAARGSMGTGDTFLFLRIFVEGHEWRYHCRHRSSDRCGTVVTLSFLGTVFRPGLTRPSSQLEVWGWSWTSGWSRLVRTFLSPRSAHVRVSCLGQFFSSVVAVFSRHRDGGATAVCSLLADRSEDISLRVNARSDPA